MKLRSNFAFTRGSCRLWVMVLVASVCLASTAQADTTTLNATTYYNWYNGWDYPAQSDGCTQW